MMFKDSFLKCDLKFTTVNQYQNLDQVGSETYLVYSSQFLGLYIIFEIWSFKINCR